MTGGRIHSEYLFVVSCLKNPKIWVNRPFALSFFVDYEISICTAVHKQDSSKKEGILIYTEMYKWQVIHTKLS